MSGFGVSRTGGDVRIGLGRPSARALAANAPNPAGKPAR